MEFEIGLQSVSRLSACFCSEFKFVEEGEKGGIFVDFLKVCVVINKRMDLFLQKINIVFYCSFETRKDLHTRRKKNEYNKFSLIFIKK